MHVSKLRNLVKPAPFTWRLIRFGIYKLPAILKNYIIGIFKTKLKRQKCYICQGKDVRFIYASWAYIFFRCLECDVYFVGNPPGTQRLYREYVVSNREEYLRERGKYFALDQNGEFDWRDWKAWKSQTFIKFNLLDFEKELGFPRRALEIGSAEGKALEILKDRKWIVVGLDIGEYVSRLCGRAGLMVILGRAEDMVFKDGCFDLVVMFHTLEHTINPLFVLRNIFNVLKRKGRFILEVPYFKNKKALLKDFNNIAHLYFFTEKAINRMSNIIGFNQLDKFIYEDQLHKPQRNVCYLFEKSL